MIKIIIICCALSTSLSCCLAQENRPTEIRGNVENSAITKMYVTRIDSSLRLIDSCEIRNGKFSFQIQLNKADIYELRYHGGHLYLPIVLEPGSDIEVTISDNNKTTVKVYSGEEEKKMQLLKPALDAYSNALNNMPRGGGEDFAEWLNNENKKLAEAIALLSPRSLAAIHALASMLGVEDELFFEIYQSLIDTTNYTDSHHFKRIQDDFRVRKSRILVGTSALDFEAKTINGSIFNLSQLRGKYVVLNFWASWCKPCREKNKEIAGYLRSSAKEDFVLVSFNVDETQDAWRDASEKDRITWLNVSNERGFEGNDVLTGYKVTRLPAIFLISPEGVVLSQNSSLREIMARD